MIYIILLQLVFSLLMIFDIFSMDPSTTKLPLYSTIADPIAQLPLTVTLPVEKLGFHYDCPNKPIAYKANSAITKEQFLAALALFKTSMKSYLKEKPWVQYPAEKQTNPSEKFFTGETFEPYIQKIDGKADQEVYFIGDLHSDPHSFLQQMKILRDKGYFKDNSFELKSSDNKPLIIIQGDCNNSGNYGAELWTLLFYFKHANPNNFFIIRGNHEDRQMAQDSFHQELIHKLGLSENETEQVHHIYNLLPLAICLGAYNAATNHTYYAVASHAGLDMHNINPVLASQHAQVLQLLGPLQRNAFLKKFPTAIKRAIEKKKENDQSLFKDEFEHDNHILKSPQDPIKLGWCWNFYTDEPNKIVDFSENINVISYGKDLTSAVMDMWRTDKYFGIKTWKWLNSILQRYAGKRLDSPTYSVDTNIRSHQHTSANFLKKFPNSMLSLIKHKGLYKQWAPVQEQVQEAERKYKTVTPGSVFTTLCAPNNLYGLPTVLNQENSENDTDQPTTTKLQLFNFVALARLILKPQLNEWYWLMYGKKMFSVKNIPGVDKTRLLRANKQKDEDRILQELNINKIKDPSGLVLYLPKTRQY